VVFAIDILINFFLEKLVDQTTIERRLSKVIVIYLKNGFLYDFLAILPLTVMFEGVLAPKYNQLLYLVRLLRMIGGLKIFD
jgi:hypothetical protein